nr:4-hydroxyphenylpyruvate dioxygenase [Xanthomonadales bacterium]
MSASQQPHFPNPLGIDGFEFVEYASPEPKAMHALFRQMGFTAVARHKSRAITL